MKPLAMAIDDEIRLYSRGYQERTPVDVLAPEHADIHALLVRWGAWARARVARRGLASIEGLYRKAGGSPSTAPLSADPDIVNIDRALVRMPEQHRNTLIRIYAYGLTPCSVCKMLRLRYEAWPAWVGTCRAMARNLLRAVGR